MSILQTIQKKPVSGRCFVIALIICVMGCEAQTVETIPFTETATTTNPAPASPAMPAAADPFEDVTANSGIAFTTGFSGDFALTTDIPNIFPSGVAAGDYDNDGDIDLFIVRGDRGPNLLYRNVGAMRFEEVAAGAGLAFTKSSTEQFLHGTPAFADLDGDGDLDILITGVNSDPTLVFANNGDGTFVDVSQGSGLDLMTAEHSHSPAFGDYDLDGDLDLLLGHWGSRRDFVNGPGDTEHLWRNDSTEDAIKFTSVSIQAGLAPSILTNDDPLIPQRRFDNTFTPTFARINNDAYPDILMVGDFNFSQVFLNQGDGTFENVTDFDVIIDGNGMGSAVGDYDGDGDLDWFVSSILARGNPPPSLSPIGNRLYRNDSGEFRDVTEEAGVADGGWGWGSCFLDLDNDGDLDIYQTNGWVREEEFGPFPTDETRVFVNDGFGTFVDNSQELGLADREQGRGIVCADFDRDGDVDVIQFHMNTTNAVTVWENMVAADGGNFLAVTLQGLPPNTQAIGARIIVTSEGQEQLRDVLLGSNFASHNPTEQFFGLGQASRVDGLRIIWPDGVESFFSPVEINQHMRVRHPDL